MVRFPPPLQRGDLIAVTAPSSGVSGASLARLDLVLQHLRALGYRVEEGACLRQQHKDASAPCRQRADELNRLLREPAVAAILPPWGGELASQLLPLIDFEALRALPPKWFMGYSDLSTLQLPLTLVSGWATVHGPNLMDLVPTETEPLTAGALALLATAPGQSLRQLSSERYQTRWIDHAQQVDAPLNLSEATCWRRLDGQTGPVGFEGRLIGGCLDTIAWLAGSAYGDVPGFIRRSGAAGSILYLENVEMAPTGLVRALLALRRSGWFEGLRGVLIGRHAAPAPGSPTQLSFDEAVAEVLGDLTCPVLLDVDIGHRPPQFTLFNGALAEVGFADGRGVLVQHRPGD